MKTNARQRLSQILRATLSPLVLACGVLMLYGIGAAAQQLQVTFGTKGVDTLSYNGVDLESTVAYPEDTFHIWHMKTTDFAGNVLSSGQYGWGESNFSETWDPQTHTETYTFSWGSISTQFVLSGNNLNLIVTETNTAGSGIVFEGAEIYPLVLHFPQEPAGFNGYTQYAITTTDPGVSAADFGAGVVTAVVPDESVPLYTGWKSAGPHAYSPILSSTGPDGLAIFLPHHDRPVEPGSSFSYTVSLRFTPEGVAADAADAYASFAAAYPSQMTWIDKRIIGTAYLASSPASNGDITQPGGFPTNPRRYFADPGVDVMTSVGLKGFQNRMLAQANSNVENASNLNAQGVITWDLEGEQFPQSTSYVCSPEQIAAAAPEMESRVLDSTSPYVGQKLDDAYFKIMTAAGLRVGVCLRPQVFSLVANGTASQLYLATDAAIVANLEKKAKYAYTRWSVTLFYIDSSVNADGGTLNPAIFQQLITDLPNFLFIPEETTTRYYAYTAPFYSFIFKTELGTPTSVYKVYPKAFGANLVNDVSSSTLAKYEPQLTASVANGDILMGHADYRQDNNPTLVSIYRSAAVSTPPSPTAIVTWPTPSSITYGTALSAAQLYAQSNIAGTFAYSPAPGTILSAGVHILTVIFTPANTVLYKPANANVLLTVVKAQPDLNWPAPAPVAYGTALSAGQLNATTNIAGSFSYSPGEGTVLDAGTHILTAVFTPADTTNFDGATAEVTLTVTETMVVFGPIRHGPVLPSSAPKTSRGSHPKALSGLYSKPVTVTR